MMENISAKGYFEMFMDYIYSTEPAKKRFFFLSQQLFLFTNTNISSVVKRKK